MTDNSSIFFLKLDRIKIELQYNGKFAFLKLEVKFDTTLSQSKPELTFLVMLKLLNQSIKLCTAKNSNTEVSLNHTQIPWTKKKSQCGFCVYYVKPHPRKSSRLFEQLSFVKKNSAVRCDFFGNFNGGLITIRNLLPWH